MLHPEHLLTRSQDLEETYHDAGQFYWVTCERFLQSYSLKRQLSFSFHATEYKTSILMKTGNGQSLCTALGTFTTVPENMESSQLTNRAQYMPITTETSSNALHFQITIQVDHPNSALDYYGINKCLKQFSSCPTQRNRFGAITFQHAFLDTKTTNYPWWLGLKHWGACIHPRYLKTSAANSAADITFHLSNTLLDATKNLYKSANEESEASVINNERVP